MCRVRERSRFACVACWLELVGWLVLTRLLGCYRFTSNFEQRVAKLTDEPPKFDQVHEGFATLTLRAIEALADLIFLDLTNALTNVGTRQWRDAPEPEIAAILDTFEDYFTNDVHGCILENHFRKLTEITLEKLARRYVTEMLRTTNKASISKEVAARMRTEITIIEDYYKTRISKKVRALERAFRTYMHWLSLSLSRARDSHWLLGLCFAHKTCEESMTVLRVLCTFLESDLDNAVERFEPLAKYFVCRAIARITHDGSCRLTRE